MSPSQVTTSLSRRDHETPETHLLFSIVSLVLCPPLGIAAILSSTKVRVAIGMNNMSLAHEASANAARLSLIGVFLGSNIAMLVASLVLAIVYQAS